MIYVTHDQVEAMTMGTEIVVMKDGIIQQNGPPLDIYNFPYNKFVAGFLGSPVMNFVPCKIISRDDRLFIDTEAFVLPIPQSKAPYYQSVVGQEVIFGIRPNSIYDRLYAPESVKENLIQATVEVVEPLGSETQLYLRVGKNSVIASVDVQVTPRIGQDIEMVLDLEKMHLFETEPPNLRIRADH